MSNMIRNDQQMSPQVQQGYVDDILSTIEKRDPSPNKQYTQWLARMYAVGDIKIEDLNRGGALTAYDIGKKRRLIKPEHSDINRFKTYLSFEDTILGAYELDQLQGHDKVELPKGQANKIYEDGTIRVIAPEDEAAACYYGQGTKWCTAGRTNNMFDFYHGEGLSEKLYIIIPKKPSYIGEKYQFHIASDQYMNEKDQEIDPKTVVDQYPSIAIALKHPAIASMTTQLMPAEVREKIFQRLSRVISTEKRDLLKRVNNPDLRELANDPVVFDEDYEGNLELFHEYEKIDDALRASIRDFRRGMYGQLSAGLSDSLAERIEHAVDDDIAELKQQLPSMY